VAVLAIMVALLLPAMSKAKARSSRINCVNNLKQVGLSFRQWALDNNDEFPMRVSITNGGAMEWTQQGIAWRVFQVMSNELNTPKVLVCPWDSDTNRTVAASFGSASVIPFTNNQNLSYFAGADAVESQTNLLLTGDSHFEVGGKPLAAKLQELSNRKAIGWTKARHERKGNLGITDGSVRLFTSKELPAVFKATGLATNRLVLP